MEQDVEWLDTTMPGEAATKLNHRAVRALDIKKVLKASRGLTQSGDKLELKQRVIHNWHNVDQATFTLVMDERIRSQATKAANNTNLAPQ